MENRSISCAVLSSDTDFTSLLSGEAGKHAALDVVHSFTGAVSAVSVQVVEAMLALSPDVVFLDIESGPPQGLKLAEYLIGADPALQVVIAGKESSRDFLLAVMRTGASEYLEKPVGPKDLSAAIDRIRRRLPAAARPAAGVEKKAPAVVSLFTGARAGLGTTTLVASVAAVLAERESRRVLVLDLDFEGGDVDLHFGTANENSVGDLLKNLHRVDGDMLDSFVHKDETGVHVLRAAEDPKSAAHWSRDSVAQTVRLLRRHYDHVLIDCGAPHGLATSALGEKADNFYFVCRPTLAPLRAARRVLPLLDAERVKRPEEERVRLVLTAVREDEEIADADLSAALGRGAYHRLPYDERGIAQALSTTRPAALQRGAWRESVAVLAARIGGDPVEALQEKGLSRFFGRRRESKTSTER